MTMLTPRGAGNRRRGSLTRVRVPLRSPRRRSAGGFGGARRPSGVDRRRNRLTSRGRLLGVLLVLAVLAGGWWFGLREPDAIAVACPPPASAVPPAPAPPPPVAAGKIKLNVYNATERQGLAKSVGDELRGRGFRVKAVANDPRKTKVPGVALVRHGGKGADEARTVGAQVLSVETATDSRKDSSVDLVLGEGYTSLRTPEEVSAALAPPPPAPARPAGC